VSGPGGPVGARLRATRAPARGLRAAERPPPAAGTATDASSRGIAALPRAQLETMHAAGVEILECYRVLRKAGLNVVGEMLRGAGTFYEYNHYPENDVYDRETHAQYYYHAHRGLEGEHGHFHTFLRKAGMPRGISPLDVPHEEPWPEGDESLAHLIAISMDAYGYPIGLFAPNRWVTADAWYGAADLIAMLERFRIDHAYPSWPVNRWISAMLVLFRPHIETLLAERDRVVARWREALPGEDVLERRELEILSSTPISVDATLAEVSAALG
jgi:hypothetical protein